MLKKKGEGRLGEQLVELPTSFFFLVLRLSNPSFFHFVYKTNMNLATLVSSTQLSPTGQTEVFF